MTENKPRKRDRETVDFRKEYQVTLGRWERFHCQIILKAPNRDAAIRMAKKAARSMDYDGWDGQAEVDTTEPVKIEREVIDVEVIDDRQ